MMRIYQQLQNIDGYDNMKINIQLNTLQRWMLLNESEYHEVRKY